MRRKRKYSRLLTVIGVCLFYIMIASTDGADKIKIGKNVRISTDVKMEIMEDGQLTENKLLVHLVIYDYKDKIHVHWDHIYIAPQHDMKQVLLKCQSYSVEDGSVYGVGANNDNFSFTIHVGRGQDIKIVGNKVKGRFIYSYSIQGVALWWSDIIKDKIKIEWRSTTKKFILPYTEVF